MASSAKILVLTLLAICVVLATQQTAPTVPHKIASDEQLQKLQKESQFASRKTVAQKDVNFGKDARGFNPHDRCKHSDLDIRWQKQAGASIYQTPVIFDLFADGKKEIVLPTFVRYLEVLQGATGAEAHSLISNHRHDEKFEENLHEDHAHPQGASHAHHHNNHHNHNHQHVHEVQQWPFSHSNFASHSSSVLYDIDGDGNMEIVQPLATGEIVFFKQSGSILKQHTLRVMPLKVKKNWYQGLDESNVQIPAKENEEKKDDDKKKSTSVADEKIPRATDAKTEKTEKRKKNKKQTSNKKNKKNNNTKKNNKKQGKKNDIKPNKFKSRKTNSIDGENDKPTNKGFVAATEAQKKQQQEEAKATTGSKPNLPKRVAKKGYAPNLFGVFSTEAKKYMDMISYFPSSLIPYVDEKIDNPFHSAQYEKDLEALRLSTNHDEFVLVDAHLLSAPVIADIDGDGHDELIVTVSYYFDKEFYSRPENMQLIDPTVDLGKYVAGGVVVFDLTTLKQKWDIQFDLSTDKTKLKAYIYSSPTVADIDADGHYEIVVGTALGFIYVLDRRGAIKSGWPVQLGQIQGQVIAEDVNADGDLELCAVDFKSNLVCFNSKGKVIWERQLSGFSAQAPAVGDINGDGVLELVVGTSAGHIWAVSGEDGKVLPHFPILTHGAIYSPALIAELNTTTNQEGIFDKLLQRGTVKASKGLSVIVPSFDGFIYIIDGATGCVDKIDIGEKSYSQVLIDDLSGNDKMDLLVTTMNGNVYAFGTSQEYHPMKTASTQISSVNGFAYRHNYHGIYVQPESRRYRDVIGNNFKVHFEIVDERKLPNHIIKNYHVKISIGRKTVLLEKSYRKPGKYVEMVYAPSERMFGTIMVEMTNEHGQHYQDAFSVSFNMGFMGVIKWAIVIPFVLATSTLIYMFSGKTALPA